MENCVLQCETTGVIVRTSARLTMNMCDLYGSKGAGVEIYPGSVCSLVGNGIHHCKDGILIKDFADELDVMPSITMENNVIHNNEGYGVVLVKPNNTEQHSGSVEKSEDPAACTAEDKQQGKMTDLQSISTLSTSSSSATSATTTPTSSSSTSLQPEPADSNSMDGDTASSAGRKWQLSHQLSRNKEMSCSRAVEDLMDHQIFVSNQGNQFKRNGMGNFGTFFY